MAKDLMEEIIEEAKFGLDTPGKIIAHEILKRHPDAYKKVQDLDKIRAHHLHPLHGEEKKKYQMVEGLAQSMNYFCRRMTHTNQMPRTILNPRIKLLQDIAIAAGQAEEKDGIIVLTKEGEQDLHAYRESQHSQGEI